MQSRCEVVLKLLLRGRPVAQGQDVREILVKDIVVGEGQVRLRDLDKGIEELAASIRLHGLLEPIVVHSTKDGRFEVLMGQRRLLAHQRLGKRQILAVIVDRPIDETSAKTLSLTENMVRTALNPKDVIDACGVLYRKYGSARSVAEETGLPYPEVLKHIKYDRLVPALRALVDTGEIRMDVALKAQDAAGVTDESGQKETVKLSSMTVAQQRQAVKARRKDPKTPVDELVDRVTRDGGSRQITVTLSAAQHRGLQALAKKEGLTQDEFAARLVVAGLAT